MIVLEGCGQVSKEKGRKWVLFNLTIKPNCPLSAIPRVQDILCGEGDPMGVHLWNMWVRIRFETLHLPMLGVCPCPSASHQARFTSLPFSIYVFHQGCTILGYTVRRKLTSHLELLKCHLSSIFPYVAMI